MKIRPAMRIFVILLGGILLLTPPAYGQSPERQPNSVSPFSAQKRFPCVSEAAVRGAAAFPVSRTNTSVLFERPSEFGTQQRTMSLLSKTSGEGAPPLREGESSIREFTAYWNKAHINELLEFVRSLEIPPAVRKCLGLLFLCLIILYRILYVLCDLADILFKWLLDRLCSLCVRLYKQVMPRFKKFLSRTGKRWKLPERPL